MVVAAALPVFITPAAAGSFQVSPINITVPHNRPIGAVTVRNEADEPVSIRVVTLKWTQENGKDVYSETKDILASPPIFNLAARGAQLIRVGLRKPGSEAEEAYRVILEEIPGPASDGTGIRVSLRLNLPFYKQPSLKSSANVRWSFSRSKDGEMTLQAANAGTLHDQISRVDIVDASGTRTRLLEQAGVVLAGSTRKWPARKIENKLGQAMKLIVVKPSGEERAEALVQDPL